MPLPNRRLPNFIIIGAQKSASTFVQDALALHPDIHMPGNETRFFEDPEYGCGDITELARLFDGRAEKLLGIKRPDYLGREEVPARIHAHLPEAKLVVVLRNPIDRMISAYYYYIKLGFLPPMDINQAIPQLLAGRNLGSVKSAELLAYGRYATHLRRYHRFFAPEQIHVLLQEDIKKDPARAIGDVCRFLGVGADGVRQLPKAANTGVYPLSRLRFLGLRNRFLYDYDATTGKLKEKSLHPGSWIPAATITAIDRWFLSRTIGNAKPELDATVRESLANYYRDEIAGTAELTGRTRLTWN